MSLAADEPLKLRAGVLNAGSPSAHRRRRRHNAWKPTRKVSGESVGAGGSHGGSAEPTFSVEAEVLIPVSGCARLSPRAVLTTSKKDEIIRVPAAAVIFLLRRGRSSTLLKTAGSASAWSSSATGSAISSKFPKACPPAPCRDTELTRIHQGSSVEIKKEN